MIDEEGVVKAQISFLSNVLRIDSSYALADMENIVTEQRCPHLTGNHRAQR